MLDTLGMGFYLVIFYGSSRGGELIFAEHIYI